MAPHLRSGAFYFVTELPTLSSPFLQRWYGVRGTAERGDIRYHQK